MFGFITNMIIGLGWAFVFITAVPYLIAIFIVAFSKERNPNVVNFLKLYLLLPAFLILVSVVRAFAVPNKLSNNTEISKTVETVPMKEMKTVIVGLNVPHTNEGDLTNSQIREQRATLSKAQNELLKLVPGEVEEVTRFWFIPAMTLKVD